ncbi:MAG: hypothetical protein OXB92_08435, partial [Acidimicrobiaceae bacterium]|nr:hypothetical protein [Acidimicrobiaceae bacterium]
KGKNEREWLRSVFFHLPIESGRNFSRPPPRGGGPGGPLPRGPPPGGGGGGGGVIVSCVAQRQAPISWLEAYTSFAEATRELGVTR